MTPTDRNLEKVSDYANKVFEAFELAKEPYPHTKWAEKHGAKCLSNVVEDLFSLSEKEVREEMQKEILKAYDLASNLGRGFWHSGNDEHRSLTEFAEKKAEEIRQKPSGRE